MCQGNHWVKMPKDKPSVQIHYDEIRHHWVCSSVNENGEVFLYDTLYKQKTTPSLDNQLALIYGEDSKMLSITVPNVQQQRGTSDCGLFAAAIATALAYGQDPRMLTWDQSIMIMHFKECIDRTRHSVSYTYY